MGVVVLRRLAYVMTVAALLGVAACSGGVGSGTGLPAPPGYNVTPSAQAASQPREHTTAGAIYLAKDLTELKFPSSTGFGFSIDLGPAVAKAAAGAKSSPSPTPTPSPAPTATAAAKTKGKSKPTPTPSPSGPKIDTKVTVFPLDAPAAPSPEPTGDVQSYAERVPIMRTYLMSQAEIKLASLAAIHFKLPKEERPDGRGFTVAVFESHKHKKFGLIAWQAEATLDGDTVTADESADPITLKKKMGYVFVLYGDDLQPTPVPRGQYPAPGNNPFATAQPTRGPFGYPSQFPLTQPTPYQPPPR